MKKLFKSLLPVVALLLGASQMQADEMEFTYANGNNPSRYGLGGNATKMDAHYLFSIKIDDANYQGMKVVGAKVYNAVDDISGFGNYSFIVFDEMQPNEITPLDTKAFTVKNGEGEVRFDNPVEIGAEGIFVGMTLDATMKAAAKGDQYCYCLPVSEPKDVENSNWLQINNGGWTDYSRFGSACIIVYLEGESKTNAVAITGVSSSSIIEAGKPYQVALQMKNLGITPVTSWNVTYSVNDGAPVQGGGELGFEFKPGDTKTVTFDMPALTDTANYKLTLAVDQVNGATNEAVTGSIVTNVCIPGKSAVRKVVMEECTGTWCGWCTRGLLAMGQLKKVYPWNFIGLAYHNGDVMDINYFGYPFNFGSGLPGCALDRSVNAIDPYYGTSGDTKTPVEFGIKDDVHRCMQKYSDATVNVTSEFNEDKSEITITSHLVFNCVNNQGYKVGYVLVQNDICKPDNGNFTQNNYYSGQSETGMLAALCEQPSKITGFVFDDIVINSDYSAGIKNSVPVGAQIQYGEMYDHSITLKDVDMIVSDLVDQAGKPAFSAPADNLATDPEEMQVVALLIAADGTIVNAGINQAGIVGINDIVASDNSQNAPVEFYDLQGRRVSTPAVGHLYIKRQGNKASKIIL